MRFAHRLTLGSPPRARRAAYVDWRNFHYRESSRIAEQKRRPPSNHQDYPLDSHRRNISCPPIDLEPCSQNNLAGPLPLDFEGISSGPSGELLTNSDEPPVNSFFATILLFGSDFIIREQIATSHRLAELEELWKTSSVGVPRVEARREASPSRAEGRRDGVDLKAGRWFAKRFLHPDIVAPYDYIFIWDEDLGVEHFNAEEYIKLVKKHGLEISQPGLEANEHLTWKMTERRRNKEVHKESEEKSGWCPDPHLPPCAAFIEIMAPVFSREAWRCAWHMIQNDLVHGWGLDFALRRCVEFAHERIGIVDAQWIVHQGVPTLGNQVVFLWGLAQNGKSPRKAVEDRCREEWRMFQDRMASAEKAYFETHAKP
ncbi:hypothetical protein ZIOFF_035762 [Zingiber officinale]|uniref:Uncharacterized protein n=1 Tax=Zingiber officinale TaxID=94328 RepID=A0A8J5GH18_ZINOF|nr:hypothetical protein ZIOFF_035762 [Zingiber officinale]